MAIVSLALLTAEVYSTAAAVLDTIPEDTRYDDGIFAYAGKEDNMDFGTGHLLPAGSVVLLADSDKRVMIMGYLQAKPGDTGKVYDYCGCLYPEGYLEADRVYLFDHEQIEKVYAVGYMDEEQFAFREELYKAYEEIKK